MNNLQFSEADEFKLDGFISKEDGTIFTSKEIEDLSDAFFEWLEEKHLLFGGAFGTEMEEKKG